MNITDIAREAGFHVDDWETIAGCTISGTHEELEAFAAAIKAAHLAELCSMEMPEPEAWFIDASNGMLPEYEMVDDKYKNDADVIAMVTLDQLQTAVAAAVAKAVAAEREACALVVEAADDGERNDTTDRAWGNCVSMCAADIRARGNV